MNKFNNDTQNQRVSTAASAVIAMLVLLVVNAFSQSADRDTLRVVFRVKAPNATNITTSLTSAGGGCTGWESVIVPHRPDVSPSFGPGGITYPPQPMDTLIASAPVVSQGVSSVLHGRHARVLPSMVKYGRGSVMLNLNSQQYRNAEISLFSVNGKRVLRGKASASKGAFDMSHKNLAPGAYLISVKGVGGNTFASKVMHSGGKLNINAVFGGSSGSTEFASVEGCGKWTLTVTADGYETYKQTVYMTNAINDTLSLPAITLTPEVPQAPPKALPGESYTESAGNIEFDMVYVPGGTFTLGCDDAYRVSAGLENCPPNTGAVSATVSNYYIAKDRVSLALWNAVMGTSGNSVSYNWYEAHIFACRLGKMTGRSYRMMTEAEFEYAAKNGFINGIGGSTGSSAEEWAYNTWNTSHMGGTDPVGPGSGTHNQKTRRNASAIGDAVTGRLIRSIEGIGPQLRVVVSANNDFPPTYVPPCDLHAPEFDEPENSYRDPRWVTGDNETWDFGYAGNFMFWEDGTVRSQSNNYVSTGQWFTSNNIVLVVIMRSQFSTTPTVTRYPYIFLDPNQGSTPGGIRYSKSALSTPVEKPTVADLKSGRDLAMEQGDEYKMIDMSNIPAAAKGQDERLLDGNNEGWFQRNINYTHHYRKDVELDDFRFTVNDLSMGSNGTTVLAAGKWFTVNNVFLRVTSPNGYQADYLYTVSGNNFSHDSFQAYERGDFRQFTKTANGSAFGDHCGNLCNDEIPKGQSVTTYAPGGYFGNVGHSTFVPAPCPKGGCEQYSW